MPTKEKAETIEQLKTKFSEAGGVVISHYRGLKVEEINELRKKLRDAGTEHRVVKNTLAKLAVKGSDAEGLGEFMSGPTVFSFMPEDFVSSTKLLADFAKDHDKLEIQGGFFEGEVASAEDVIAISKLPSREELLAKLAGTLNNPITGLVRVLNGPLQGFSTALTAIKDQKEAA